MIGWRKDGTYSHVWLWSRAVMRLSRKSRDSDQLKYCHKYYKKVGKTLGLYATTYFKLD